MIKKIPTKDYDKLEALRFTELKRFMLNTPREFRYGEKPPPGAALDFGTLSHMALIESYNVDEHFIVYDEINKTTGKPYGTTSDRYKKWRAALPDDQVPGTQEEIDRARAMASYVLAQEGVELPPPNQRELTATAMVRGILCKARADWLGGDNWLYDYKTAENLSEWDFNARKPWKGLMYHWQDAFYQTVFDAALVRAGLPPVNGFRFIVVNKKEPYDYLLREQTVTDLNHAKEEIAHGIDSYRHCCDTDTWPGHHVEPGIFTPF